jgi:hypothetical protein
MASAGTCGGRDRGLNRCPTLRVTPKPNPSGSWTPAVTARLIFRRADIPASGSWSDFDLTCSTAIERSGASIASMIGRTVAGSGACRSRSSSARATDMPYRSMRPRRRSGPSMRHGREPKRPASIESCGRERQCPQAKDSRLGASPVGSNRRGSRRRGTSPIGPIE